MRLVVKKKTRAGQCCWVKFACVRCESRSPKSRSMGRRRIRQRVRPGTRTGGDLEQDGRKQCRNRKRIARMEAWIWARKPSKNEFPWRRMSRRQDWCPEMARRLLKVGTGTFEKEKRTGSQGEVMVHRAGTVGGGHHTTLDTHTWACWARPGLGGGLAMSPGP